MTRSTSARTHSDDFNPGSPPFAGVAEVLVASIVPRSTNKSSEWIGILGFGGSVAIRRASFDRCAFHPESYILAVMVLNKLLRLVPTREGGDCRDRDQCGDQRILDRHNSGPPL